MLGKKADARGGGMEAKLQLVEVKAVVLDDDDFAVKDAARRQRGSQRVEQVREVAVEGLFVAALDEYVLVVAEDECAKSVPFGFEDPVASGGEFFHASGEHGKDRRIDGKVHEVMLSCGRAAEHDRGPDLFTFSC